MFQNYKGPIIVAVVCAVVVGFVVGSHMYWGCSNLLGACVVGTK